MRHNTGTNYQQNSSKGTVKWTYNMGSTDLGLSSVACRYALTDIKLFFPFEFLWIQPMKNSPAHMCINKLDYFNLAYIQDCQIWHLLHCELCKHKTDLAVLNKEKV